MWSAVVPVKRLHLAKTRLRATLPGIDVESLVLALCLDTVRAALACPAIARVVAVTDDERAATALRTLGATVTPDEPAAGLNPALEHGARIAHAAGPVAVAVLSADLPALRPRELAAALSAAAAHLRAFVADAAGTGTTLLTVAPGEPLRAAFGPGSRGAHASSGAIELTGDWPSLRQDVDTADDLAGAAALGLGPNTRRAIEGRPWVDRLRENTVRSELSDRR